MPLVTTNISWEYEDFGRGEYLTICREVQDLDPQDALHYVQHVLNTWGYDCSQLQMITSHGKIFKTDI